MLTIIRFVFGVLTGLVVSSGLLLLLTPYSGEEFQAKVKAWLTETVAKWQQARDESRATLRAEFESRRGGTAA